MTAGPESISSMHRKRRRFCGALAGIACAHSVGCGTLSAAQLGDQIMSPKDGIPGYVERSFHFAGVSHRIFHSENAGRPVIVLHELPGLTKETKEFADWLVQSGFHVIMPLLFGAPLQDDALGTLMGPLVCLRAEFNCFRKGVASPATQWLRALCQQAHAESGGPGVGIVGMCLTGGFVLTLMADESVIAPVAAEPALPFLQGHALDVDEHDLAAAASRAATAPLMGLRFEKDSLCRQERFDAINRAFCGSTDPCPKFIQVVVPGKGHSTLTKDYPRAKPFVDTRQRVLDHLRAAFAISP
jgi:dienelactone hydrolase